MNLTELKAAADKRYGGLPITFPDGDKETTFELRNVIRLSDGDRELVTELSETLSESEDFGAVREKFVQYLGILSGEPGKVAKFVEVVDGDISIILTVIEEYQAVTQPEKA